MVSAQGAVKVGDAVPGFPRCCCGHGGGREQQAGERVRRADGVDRPGGAVLRGPGGVEEVMHWAGQSAGPLLGFLVDLLDLLRELLALLVRQAGDHAFTASRAVLRSASSGWRS